MMFSSLAAFTVPVLPSGYEYAGPSGKSKSDDNLCECNTVTYSLLSACDACQGANWLTYDPLCPCLSSFMYLSPDGLNG
jgi:hypothetical protein